MPWKESTAMEERKRFIQEAKIGIAPFTRLCQRYGISRQTGYKWLKREREEGQKGLEERSRKPKNSPAQSPPEVEAEVLRIRDEHPVWGGRKIRKIMEREGKVPVPSASTITAILRRNDKLDPDESRKREAFIRFEYEEPNQLWQMDFKGHFRLLDGQYCHPLTIVDDHSRFLVGLKACADERALTVQRQLSQIFEQYGLPERILMDNGSPWGDEKDSPFTILTTWLMQLGVGVIHSRAYHPQTNGKNERFNRTLLEEVIARQGFENLNEAQAFFDRWSTVYNTYRPHESLNFEVPSSRYEPSKQCFPSSLPVAEYGPLDIVRKTDRKGVFMYEGHKLRLGKAFPKKEVVVRPCDTAGMIEVYFYNNKIARFDLRDSQC